MSPPGDDALVKHYAVRKVKYLTNVDTMRLVYFGYIYSFLWTAFVVHIAWLILFVEWSKIVRAFCNLEAPEGCFSITSTVTMASQYNMPINNIHIFIEICIILRRNATIICLKRKRKIISNSKTFIFENLPFTIKPQIYIQMPFIKCGDYI